MAADYFPPMKGLASDQDVLEALQQFVYEAGNQKMAAERLGIGSKILSDILCGWRNISNRIAFLMGFLPAWNYVGESRRLPAAIDHPGDMSRRDWKKGRI
jgi:hypothetical protein